MAKTEGKSGCGPPACTGGETGGGEEILYMIGEIEEISGLNAQTIRRYDAKGILLGTRDNINNYRYYDSIELCMAIWIRYLRNFGFSLNEVEKFINGDLENQVNMVHHLDARLKREQRLLACRLDCLKELRIASERALADPEECGVQTRPAMLGTFYRDRDKLIRDEEDRTRMAHWINSTPMVRPMFCVGHSFLFDKDHPNAEYKIGQCIPVRYNKIVGIQKDKYSVSIPSCRCIHTVYEGYDALKSRTGYLDLVKERIERFARDNALTLSKKPIYGSSFYSRRREEGLHHLAHMWIPIE